MRIAFEEFWKRLQGELLGLPKADGYHIGKVKKWSQDKDWFGEEFPFLFKGGDVIYCQTATTTKMRTVSSAEFKKVYSV